MSLFPRLLLAAVSTIFGITMLAVARSDEPTTAVFSYAFGAFCLAIAVACVAPGRVAQFFGSLIAGTVLMLGIWYAASMLGAGTIWSGRRAEPSFSNAVAFLVVFGLPSVSYLWHARFGFRRAQAALDETRGENRVEGGA